MSFKSKVEVIARPLRKAEASCDTTTVLPRRTPCWSANERRDVSSPSPLPSDHLLGCREGLIIQQALVAHQSACAAIVA